MNHPSIFRIFPEKRTPSRCRVHRDQKQSILEQWGIVEKPDKFPQFIVRIMIGRSRVCISIEINRIRKIIRSMGADRRQNQEIRLLQFGNPRLRVSIKCSFIHLTITVCESIEYFRDINFGSRMSRMRVSRIFCCSFNSIWLCIGVIKISNMRTSVDSGFRISRAPNVDLFILPKIDPPLLPEIISVDSLLHVQNRYLPARLSIGMMLLICWLVWVSW